MTGVVCDNYNSCLVTPQQTFPNNYKTHGNDGYMNCVSYVPCQQAGLIVGNNYNFSEGYSIDPCCCYNPNVYNENNFNCNNNDFNYNGNYNFSNDYSFSEGVKLYPEQYILPQENTGTLDFGEVAYNEQKVLNLGKGKEFVEVNGTEVLPEVLNEDGKAVPLTPSFFASNTSFKRIPLQPGRTIFRKRKPGDCNSEWSNAFDKDYDDGFCLGEQMENEQF